VRRSRLHGNTFSLLVRAFRTGRLSLISLSSGPRLLAPSLTSGRPSSPVPPPLPGHSAPPSSAPRVPPSRYHPAFIFHPLIPLLNPPPSSMALKPLTPTLTPPTTPPRCSPDPYKRRAPPPSFTAPLPASFPLSPRLSITLTEHRHRRTFTAIARPPRRRPSPSEALAELPVRSSLCCALAGELWCIGAAGGRAPVSAPWPPLCPRCRWSTVDRARPAGPRMRGHGPRLYPLKNKSPVEIPRHFAKKPLCFFEINPRSSFADFALKPLCFSEINPWFVIL
jgi:hypothetical protein